jgi:hypothetical protein
MVDLLTILMSAQNAIATLERMKYLHGEIPEWQTRNASLEIAIAAMQGEEQLLASVRDLEDGITHDEEMIVALRAENERLRELLKRHHRVSSDSAYHHSQLRLDTIAALAEHSTQEKSNG